MALGRYPELQPGSELLARSFSDAVPALTIRVSSSELARGRTAVILKGEVVAPWPALVALKVVMDVQSEDSNHYIERIRREIAAVQHIKHRFILPFLGVVMGATYTILVCQFMENGNLLEYLRAKPDANRHSLIIEVADAVNYLHTEAGLVHGDLKCQNVLVSARGDAQLADFGLSTIVDKSLSTDTTTVGIRQSYTLQIAAPELLSDEAKSPAGKTRSKTPQTDVFAFGRLVLQAFTGTVPWPNLALLTVFHKVLTNAIPERREEATALGLDDKWWSVCVACWRTAPRERPTMERVTLELSGMSDRPIADGASLRKPLKPWSLPPILTNLKRTRPALQVQAAPQLPHGSWVAAGGHVPETAPSLPWPPLLIASKTTVFGCGNRAQPISAFATSARLARRSHTHTICAPRVR